MFGSNNSNSKKDSPSAKPGMPTTGNSGGHSLNSIVEGSSMEGTIKAKSDFRVDGTIDGKLFCDAKVIIGPSGRVTGEVRCENAVIEGHFEGTLVVKDLLNIRETAKVQGDVSTGKLIVQPGGIFNVVCNMGSGNNAAAPSAKKQVHAEQAAG